MELPPVLDDRAAVDTADRILTTSRTIQNFRGYRGLWWGSPAAAQALTSAMSRLGASLDGLQNVRMEDISHDRDIVFIDGDGAFDPARLCAAGLGLPIVPVIGVVGIEAPSRLKALSDAGATAFLRKPIHPSTVYSALFLAANNHARFNLLAQRVAAQDRRHGGRRHVIKAVVHLIGEHGLSDEQAFALLRRESMRRRIGIEEYAEILCTDLRHSKEKIDDAPQESLVRNGHDGDGKFDRTDRGPGGRSDQTRRA